MVARLTAFWSYLKESLWALPLGMVIAAGALAVIAVAMPVVADASSWWLYSGSIEDAADFLSTLLSSMINMATLAISITMVVLTLAAQQLGPRLIFSFMRDWRTQAALGLFIGTAVYLLLVLRIVQSRGMAGVPNLAVTAGTALVLASVVALVLFVHHLSRSIISDTIIDRVGSTLDRAISEYLPEPREKDPAAGAQLARHSGQPLRTESGGYVQVIDYDGLLHVAKKADAVIELAIRPGHHVLEYGTIGWISPRGASTDKVNAQIANCILFGIERTIVQDVEYSVRQLVDIALRALSPGINDPYTALAAVDRLALSLGRVLERGPPQVIWRDEGGTVRLTGPGSDFEGILDVAFTQIRQAAEKHAVILIRMAEKLGQLAELADAPQCAVISHHIELVLAEGRRNLPERADEAVLEQRAEAALSTCRRIIAGASDYRPNG